MATKNLIAFFRRDLEKRPQDRSDKFYFSLFRGMVMYDEFKTKENKI